MKKLCKLLRLGKTPEEQRQLKTINSYIDFLWAMTEKEVKVRYKRAAIGFLWVVLNPVLQMLIVGFIFSFFIKIPNYFLFLFTGLLPWTFFSSSLSKATPSIVYERYLLQKAKFPIEAIPVSIILSNFLHALVSFALLFSFLLVTDRLIFPQVILVIPSLIWLLAFTIGISLLTSALYVRFRDINFLVQTALALWFYGTPILYNLTLIPAGFRFLFALNPLTSIFELFHFSVLNQGVVDYQIAILNLLSSIIIIVFGIVIFRKQNRYFVDWL